MQAPLWIVVLVYLAVFAIPCALVAGFCAGAWVTSRIQRGLPPVHNPLAQRCTVSKPAANGKPDAIAPRLKA